MSALIVKGMVVAVQQGKPFVTPKGKEIVIHSVYVVNGNSAPVQVRYFNQAVPSDVKQGQKVEIPVEVGVFNNQVNISVSRV